MRVLLVVMVLGCASCASAESRYTKALLRCVAEAQTLPESKACRRDVDADFGVDGGR